MDEIRKKDRHITMETQGSVFHPVINAVDLLSYSPKIERQNISDIIEFLSHVSTSEVQIKLVISNLDDLNKSMLWIQKMREVKNECVFILQPEYSMGKNFIRNVANTIIDQKIEGVRLIPQLHKLIYSVK